MTDPVADPLAALFARYRDRGDVAAFEEAYDRSAPLLACVAARLARGGEVEDLVQATYLDAVVARERFDERAPLMPWLCGILARCARNSHRRRRPQVSDSFDPTDLGADGSGRASQRETVRLLTDAIARLPEPYETVVRRHLLEHQTPMEIAATLERPASTVRTWLSRGLDRLRKALPVGLASALAFVLDERAWANARGAALEAAGRGTAPADSPPAELATSSANLLRAGIAGALVLALAIGGWDLLGSRPEPAVPSVTADRETPDPALDRNEPNRAAPPPAPHRSPSPVPELAATVTARLRVVDAADGAPLAGMPVFVTADTAGYSVPELLDRGRIERLVTDRDGRVALEATRGSRLELGVGRARFLRAVLAGDEEVVVRVPQVLEVSGSVLDADGAAVPGADVYLSCDPLMMPGHVVARADEQGAFRFRTEPSARFVAWAVSASAISRECRSMVHAVGTVTLDLRVEAAVRTIRGRLVDGLGRGIGNARICTTASAGAVDPPWREVRTDAEGGFDAGGVSREPLLLVARAGGRAPVAHRIPAGDDREVRVVLDGSSALSGRVIEPFGGPRQMFVTATPYLTGLERRAADRLTTVPVPVSKDGAFRLAGLHPGTVIVTLSNRAEMPLAIERFELRGGEERVWTPVLHGDDAIAGRLVDAEGEPLPLFNLFLLGPGRSFRVVRTGLEGRFEAFGLRDPHYRLLATGSATSPDHRPCAERRVAPGEVEIEWALPTPTAHLVARLVDADGAPVAGARLALVWPDAALHAFTVQANRRGRVRSGPIAPAPHDVFVVGPGGAWQFVQRVDPPPNDVLDLGSLEVAQPGAVQVAFELPPGAQQPQNLELRASRGGHRVPLVPGVGGFGSETPLPPGEHVLCATGPGFAPVRQPIVTQSGRTTALTLRPAAAATVTVSLAIDYAQCPKWGGELTLRVRDATTQAIVAEAAQWVNAAVESWSVGLLPGRYEIEAVMTWGAVGRGEFTVDETTDASSAVRIDVR